MPTTIDTESRELVKKILLAPSQNAVMILIDATLGLLIKNKIEPILILKFIDITVRDIEALDTMQIDALQWSHIKVGKLILNRRKREFQRGSFYQH